MRWRIGVVGLMAAAVTAAACSTTTDPVLTGQVAQIAGITTPAHATATDTIKVSFSYITTACDTGATVEARRTPDGYRFTARSFTTELNCAGVNGPHAVGFSIAPPQDLPSRLIFSQPDGNDSVRVVAAP
jgi:hypothetical protein